MQRLWRVYAGASLSFALLGCSPVSVSEIKQYSIDNGSVKRFSHQRPMATIMVAAPTAASGYESSDMLYVKKPYQLEPFAKNAWVGPPAEMFNSVIVSSLQNTGYFRAVVEPPYFGGQTLCRLNTTILELKQSFLSKPSEVMLTIKADVILLSSGKVVASHRFHDREQAPEDTPYGGVLAANKASQVVMEKLSAFVIKACRA